MREKDLTCNIDLIDEAKVELVKKTIPSDEDIFELANSFKVLGDSTRLKILLALSKEELCVCDLSALVGVSVSAISHQLRLLRNIRYVSYRKEGKMVYYSLADKHIYNIVSEAITHTQE